MRHLQFRPGHQILLLSMRHLGDSVILAGFVNALNASYPDIKVDVLGKPGLERILRPLCSIRDYIEIEAPLYGHHKRSPRHLKQLVRNIVAVRRRDYDCCINLMGDLRENVIGWLAGTRMNVAPLWSDDHIFRNKIRMRWAAAFIDGGVTIPPSHPNFYDAMDYFAVQLGLTPLHWPSSSQTRMRPIGRGTIALHPGASHSSRHWPSAKWRALVKALRGMGFHVQLMGASSELQNLQNEFVDEISAGSVEVLVGTPHDFFANLSGVDLLVGMDSFSVHAAYAMGVKTIVLNGPADPVIMTPPGASVLSAGKGCHAYPCYNRPSCLGTAGEYLCVRDIDVGLVVQAIEKMMGSYPARSTTLG